jgi:uncharacterized NAD-dependent epimerase/dehydratase family protein
MNTVKDLNHLLVTLQVSRMNLDAGKNLKAELERELQADPAYLEAVELVNVSIEEITKTEELIKSTAVELYNANKEAGKKLAGGNVSIIDKVTASITDQQAAYDWAVKEAPKMIILDESAILKHAKAVKDTIPLDFVAITTEPKAQISSEIKLELIEETENDLPL